MSHRGDAGRSDRADALRPRPLELDDGGTTFLADPDGVPYGLFVGRLVRAERQVADDERTRDGARDRPLSVT
jgi:hypothetical protein